MRTENVRCYLKHLKSITITTTIAQLHLNSTVYSIIIIISIQVTRFLLSNNTIKIQI